MVIHSLYCVCGTSTFTTPALMAQAMISMSLSSSGQLWSASHLKKVERVSGDSTPRFA